MEKTIDFECANCEYIGAPDFYWLITNDKTGKADAVYDLCSSDMGFGDYSIEVECCPKCGCDI